MRGWDGRMTADSAAPTIGYRARVELSRLLLEPKLGAAPTVPAANMNSDQGDGSLNWKTYGWGMQSVWLENILQHQPKRWLPDSYSSYDDLLEAAVEAGRQWSGSTSGLDFMALGQFRPVEIQHPILGRIPVLRRWSGPGTQPQSGSGYTVKAVSAEPWTFGTTHS